MTPVLIISIVVAIVVLVPVVAMVIGGARVARTVECPANEWTRIVNNFGTGFARTIAVEIRGGSGVPGGNIDSADGEEDHGKDIEEDDPRGVSDDVESGEPAYERVPGRWRVVRPARVLSNESVAGDLATSMTFQRRWIDWRYRIEVRPDEDITAVLS